MLNLRCLLSFMMIPSAIPRSSVEPETLFIVQVLVGDIDAVNSSHREFFHVWKKYGVMPERYLLDHQMLHPTEKYYPLCPEFAESSFYLYQATKDPWYLEVGETIIKSLNSYTKVDNGFSSVRDVTTMQLEVHQHSFFLSETLTQS